MFNYMPAQGSDWAANIDFLNELITDISVYCTIAIIGTMLYFAMRYRRRTANDKTPHIVHSTALEVTWTIIPTAVCMFLFVVGFQQYHEERNPPANAIEINVQAYSWRWEFEYPNGRRSTNELTVPLGMPVRLIMHSNDVLHSFYIPVMRVKEDVMKNIYTYLWFKPILAGDFHIFCAEYCGLNHSAMRATLHVVSPEQYQDFLTDRNASNEPELPPAELGKKVFGVKGCNACHSLDGSKIIGPSLKGAFGSERPLADGSKVMRDENYIRESILNPRAKVCESFPDGVMPAFEGQLSEKELTGLVEFIKSLK